MDIGQLNQRADVLVESTVPDEIGQPMATWTVYKAKLHCRIRNLSGSQEGQKAGGVYSTVRSEIRFRYRNDLTNAMRISHKGRTYRIIGVRPNEMNMDWVDVDCELIE